MREVQTGARASFEDFIAGVQRRRSELASTGLTSIHDQGWACLLFGFSDKPDEASLPSEEHARKGLKPLHRLETLGVGEA